MFYRYIPNIITILRILVVLPFIYVTLLGDYRTAFYLFFLASLSDGLDGFLARFFGWSSRLGALLDPLADKLLMVVSYALMAWIGAIPSWLFILVLLRDVIIVCGILTVMAIRGAVAVKPFLVSKINTVLQLLLMLMVLYGLAYTPIAPIWINSFIAGVVIFSILSVIAYIIAGTKLAFDR